ncbi:MAG: histidine phosphatase family protein [Stackebrandtia sp.]
MAVPPWRWRLDDDARELAANLADELPAAITLVASTEVKAQQTAAAIARRRRVAVAVDAGFDEVRRPRGFDPRHRDTAASYLDGATLPSWEARGEVAARFGAAVDRHRRTDSALVVVSHGMAMSLWAAHVQTRQDVVAAWRGLRFPDVVAVSVS